MVHINNPRVRLWLADNLALLSFFTTTGMMNERFIAGMEWHEVLTARVIGAPLMILTARPYGIWRDWLIQGSGHTQPSAMKVIARDTLALVSFQVPLYAAIIWIGGARREELVSGILGACVIMALCGRPYGWWLDRVRAWLKVGRP